MGMRRGEMAFVVAGDGLCRHEPCWWNCEHRVGGRDAVVADRRVEHWAEGYKHTVGDRNKCRQTDREMV